MITDQEVTEGAAVQAYSAPNPFTISDLSSVWIVCDVYENDMANVGQPGSARSYQPYAFPGRVFKGKVSNIGSLLYQIFAPPRFLIEVPNPGGIMWLGMFATAYL